MKSKLKIYALICTLAIVLIACKKETIISDEPFVGNDVTTIKVDENGKGDFILTKDAFILSEHSEEIKSDDGNTTYMTINYQTIKVMSGIGASDDLIHATELFSRGIEERVKEFKELLPSAKEQFETREGFPATYEFLGKIDILTAITLEKASVLSLSSNEYLFTAGAHGITNIHYMNYDDKNNKSISIDDICNGNSADGKLETAILDKLKPQEIDLFPEYKDYVHDYFVKDEYSLDFYIDNKGNGVPTLNIVFPQYAIAPYASGIIEVKITPEKDLVDMRYFK